MSWTLRVFGMTITGVCCGLLFAVNLALIALLLVILAVMVCYARRILRALKEEKTSAGASLGTSS